MTCAGVSDASDASDASASFGENTNTSTTCASSTKHFGQKVDAYP